MTDLTCTACLEALDDCFDAGRVPDGDVARHLAACEDCRRSWTLLQAVSRELGAEPLELSEASRSRVLAYAAAHAPGAAARPAERERTGRVWWFWGLSTAVLSLLIWRWTAEPNGTPTRAPAEASMAAVSPPHVASPTEATAVMGATSLSAPSAPAEVAAPSEPAPEPVDAAPAPVAEESARSALRTGPRPLPDAKSEPEAPARAMAKAAAPMRERSPALQDEEAAGRSAAALRGAVTEGDAAAAMPVPAAPTVAAAPRVRAESAVAAERPDASPEPGATPALDTASWAALSALVARSSATGPGWTLLRAAAAAPRLAAFDAVYAACGGDALLCEGAALGAGALRFAAGRSDAAPLLTRAARSGDAAVAAAAQRLLAGR